MIKGRANKTGYQQKQQELSNAAWRNINSLLHRKYGQILVVHEENKALVRAQYDDGTLVKKGDFIPVEGANRIIEEYGQLRPGMRLVIEYTGDADLNASSRVVNDNNTDPFVEVLSVNDKDLGIYAIFTPGLTGGLL